LPTSLAQTLGLPAADLPPVLRALGLRLIPAPSLGPGQFGPPSPPLIASPRKTAPAPVALPPRPDSPFAKLASLRR